MCPLENTIFKSDFAREKKLLTTRLTYNCAHLRSTKEKGTGLFLVILGQYGAVLLDTWWYWLIYDGTGSEKGRTG